MSSLAMENMKDDVNSIIIGMKRKGLNFIAIDFDLTMASIHAGVEGWRGTVRDLEESIRPFFRVFVPQALRTDMHVAVVTFSERVKLIEDALISVFGEDAQKIVVRGNDNRWIYDGKECRLGKQTHMASAAAALKEMNFNKENFNITRRSTLLIDDCHDNIETALRNGVCAIRFNPQDEDSTVRNMLTLFPVVPDF